MSTPEEAINLLKVANSQSEIDSIISDVEISSSAGRTSVFYSGFVSPGVHSGAVAEALRSNNTNLYMDTDTGIPGVLNSSEFRDALRRIGVAEADIGAATQPFWNSMSDALADNASGKVILIVPGAEAVATAESANIFGTREFYRLLNNQSVTHINGLEKSVYFEKIAVVDPSIIELHPITGAPRLSASILDSTGAVSSAKSGFEAYEAAVSTARTLSQDILNTSVRHGVGVDGVFLKTEGLESLTNGGVADVDTARGRFTRNVPFDFEDTSGGVTAEARAAGFLADAKLIRAAAGAGKYVGPALGVIGVVVTADEVYAQYKSGDTTGAIATVTGFAAGAAVGGVLAAEAAPLLFLGPVGWVAYGIIVVGGSIIATEAAERASKLAAALPGIIENADQLAGSGATINGGGDIVRNVQVGNSSYVSTVRMDGEGGLTEVGRAYDLRGANISFDASLSGEQMEQAYSQAAQNRTVPPPPLDLASLPPLGAANAAQPTAADAPPVPPTESDADAPIASAPLPPAPMGSPGQTDGAGSPPESPAPSKLQEVLSRGGPTQFTSVESWRQMVAGKDGILMSFGGKRASVRILYGPAILGLDTEENLARSGYYTFEVRTEDGQSWSENLDINFQSGAKPMEFDSNGLPRFPSGNIPSTGLNISAIIGSGDKYSVLSRYDDGYSVFQGWSDGGPILAGYGGNLDVDASGAFSFAQTDEWGAVRSYTETTTDTRTLSYKGGTGFGFDLVSSNAGEPLRLAALRLPDALIELSADPVMSDVDPQIFFSANSAQYQTHFHALTATVRDAGVINLGGRAYDTGSGALQLDLKFDARNADFYGVFSFGDEQVLGGSFELRSGDDRDIYAGNDDRFRKTFIEYSTGLDENGQPTQRGAGVRQSSGDGDHFSAISFSQVGAVLGSNLTRLLDVEDPWAAAGVGTLLSTIGLNIGQGFDKLANGDGELGVTDAFSEAFDDFPTDLRDAGVGAMSSYLVGELVAELGLEGIPAQVATTVGGTAVSTIAANLLNLDDWVNSSGQVVQEGTAGAVRRSWDTNLKTSALNALGSFVGSWLASELVEFDTVGGQIGASIGSAIGAGMAVSAWVVGSGSSATLFGSQLGWLAGPIGAAVGAFIGFLVGGALGSLFGGKPRAGADLYWSSSSQHFNLGATWTKHGGSADGVSAAASAVAATLNLAIDATGANIVDYRAVRVGSYSMKGKVYTYSEEGLASFSSRSMEAIIGRGAYNGLSDLVDQMVGGDVYAKRAALNSLLPVDGARSKLDSSTLLGYLAMEVSGGHTEFDPNTLVGNLAIADSYKTYLANKAAIDSLIALDPTSAFAMTWVVTLASAMDLGLMKRASTDWSGGWNVFLDEVGDKKIDGDAITPNRMWTMLDPLTKERIFAVLDQNGYMQRLLGDTIDSASKTKVVGSSAGDTITLVGDAVQAGAGFTIGDEPVSEPYKVRVAAMVDAGAGDDIVRAGDLGNDVLSGSGADKIVGGKLDDWLFGDAGDDVLFAGDVVGAGVVTQTQLQEANATFTVSASAATNVDGGNGDLLDGDDGADRLYGGKGSDWLKGGAGVDQLYGGDGGDILEGGAGDDQGVGGTAAIFGGAGTDQYVFGYGDGDDVIFDEADVDNIPAYNVDSLYYRVTQVDAGALSRNWAGGGSYQVDGSIKGGEDAIVFGAGVTLYNLRMHRSGTTLAPGGDLIIELTAEDENGVQQLTGDRLTVKDWFETTRRVEWLRFTNGDEIRLGDVTSYITGTAGEAVIIGTQGGDWMIGGDQDDKFYGLGGNDFGFGGLGNDLVSGDADNDFVSGGKGDDVVIGDHGNDTLMGDGGDDRLNGGIGSDLLVGGKGDDVIITGAGDDVVNYQRGDGRDLLIDNLDIAGDVVWQDGFYVNGYVLNGSVISKNGVVYFDGVKWADGYNFDYDSTTETLTRYDASVSSQNAGWDTLGFAVGIDIQDLILRKVGRDLEIAIDGVDGVAGFDEITDRITIQNWWSETGTEADLIERFVFAATGSIYLGQYRMATNATDGADTLNGTGLADWITGNGGDDLINAGEGADLLVGGAGADTVNGGGGVDVIYGGADNDILDGGAGADLLFGGDGMDTASYASSTVGVRADLANELNNGIAAGDVYDSIENLGGSAFADTLVGDEGENVLTGALGDDRLLGGAGDDAYEFNRGDGDDSISEGVVVVDEILNEAGTLVTGFTTNWQLVAEGPVDGGGEVSYYQYQLTVTRTADSVVVYQSRPGVDFLYEDVMSGPPDGAAWPFGDGQWKAGAGRSGNGVQTVADRVVAGDGGSDTLELGPTISLSDLVATRGTNFLRFDIGGDSVTLAGWDNPERQIETLILADGLTADLTHLRLVNDAGSADEDFMLGDASANTFDGLAGDDVVSGGTGDDTLAGGGGNDIIEGGAGADILDGGSDTQSGGGTINPDDPASYGDTLRYAGSGPAVAIDLLYRTAAGGDAAGDQIVDVNGVSTFENVVGSESSDTLWGDNRHNRLFGAGGHDALYGRGGNDVLVGGDGNDTLDGGDGEDGLSGGDGDDIFDGGADKDTLFGGAGNDTMVGGNGDDAMSGDVGVDFLTGGWGDDTLIGGDGDDILYGQQDNDTLYGEAGNDYLSDGIGDNKFYGGDGNDQLAAGDGADTLSGDAGDDSLHGGAGDDTYLFDANADADTLIDAAGVNKIVITGVAQDHVWMTRSANDLVIAVIGGTTRITLSGYYLAVGGTQVREIALDDASMFPVYAADAITAMTMLSAPSPEVMPEEILSLVEPLWRADRKASPVVTDQSLVTDEDMVLAGQVGAVDGDENVTAYAVVSAATLGALQLDAATGAWTYTPNANVHGSDTFIVSVTDADDQTAEQVVTIAIASVNDAPVLVAPSALSIAENAAAGVTLGTFSSTDVDGPAETAIFSLVDSASGRFEITEGGLLKIKAGASLDFETLSSHAIVVRATDQSGAYSDQQFTVTLTNVNETPTAPSILTQTHIFAENVRENGPSLGGVAVATFGLSDPDNLNNPTPVTPQLRLVSDPNDWLEVNGATVRFKAGVQLDYETLAAGATLVDSDANGQPEYVYNFTVESWDGALSSQTAVTLRIENVNERPNAATVPGPLTVYEGSANGTVMRQFSSVDPDGPTAVVTLSLADDAGGRFEIGTDRILRVKNGAALNYEAAKTQDIVVRATDAYGLYRDQVFTVSVLNVNEAPDAPVIASQTSVIAENTVGATVASFTLIDPDNVANPNPVTPSLRIVSDTRGWMEVSGASVRFKTSAALNFETLASGVTLVDTDNDGAKEYAYTFQLEAWDGQAASAATTSVTVYVEDANEVPTNLALAQTITSVAERDRPQSSASLPAISLGLLSATDPDVTAGTNFAALVYTVSDSRFEVVNGNELRLKAGAALDYEAGVSVSFTVTAADRGGAGLVSAPITVTVQVTNQDDFLYGDANANTLTGQANRNVIYGYGGADTLNGGAVADDLFGGDGDDTLYGNGGADMIDTGAGNDTVGGGAGDDIIYGGDGGDALYGDAGDDTIYGGADKGWLSGGAGNDLIVGGIGDDVMQGNDGDDYLIGGDGYNLFYGGTGADRFLGGTGIDYLNYGQATSGVTLNLVTGGTAGDAAGDVYEGAFETVGGSAFADYITGSAADEQIAASGGDDTAIGGAGNDRLYGGTGTDTLYGGDGADSLYGEDGDDYLEAGSGDDFLDGGAGSDTLKGGDGNDTYIMNVNSGSDLIINFDPTDTDIDILSYRALDVNTTIASSDLWFEQVGDDLVITVVGTSVVTTVEDWYVNEGVGGGNHKIDFIFANDKYTVDVDGLVGLMQDEEKPATKSAYETLRTTDTDFETQRVLYWNSHRPPVIAEITDRIIDEDQDLSVTFAVTDDITGPSQIQVSAIAFDPATENEDLTLVFAPTVSLSPDGTRTVAIDSKSNTSGRVGIKIQAVDAGGLLSEEIFYVDINPVADTPGVSQAQAIGTTLDQGPLAIAIAATPGDTDGSEILTVEIAGLMAGLSLNRGAYSGGKWTLTAAQANTAGLAIIGPATTYQDQTLTVTAVAREAANGDTVSSVPVTFNVPINAKPGVISAPQMWVAESTADQPVANGYVIGQYTATDPDGDTLTYSLVDDAGGRFSISESGELSVANPSLLNYEAAASHPIVVRVSDGGLYRDQPSRVYLFNLNERPLAPVMTPNLWVFSEGVSVDSLIATASISDPDSSGAWAIEAFDPLNLVYNVRATKEIWLRGDIAYDYETLYALGANDWRTINTDIDGDGFKEVGLRVDIMSVDGQLGSQNPESTPLWIYLNDKNEAPTDISADRALTIAENSANGTLVANFSGADQDIADTATYRIVLPNGDLNVTDGRFQLSGSSLIVADSAGLNYEAATSHSVKLRVTDSKGAWYEETFTVGVSNVNEAPTSISAPALSVLESTVDDPGVNGATIGQFSATDPDNNIVSYKLVVGGVAVSTDGRFSLNATSGVLTVADPTLLNHESAASHTITVRVTDSGGLTRDQNFTVNVGNVNEKPTAAVITKNTALFPSGNVIFSEGALSNLLLGTATTTDIDSPTPWVVRSSDPLNLITVTDGAVDPNYTSSEEIRLVPGAYDYETMRAAGATSWRTIDNDIDGDGLKEVGFELKVAAVDGQLSAPPGQALWIYLEDVNEAPTDLAADRALTIAENSANGTFVANFSRTDADVNDTPVYSIVNSDGRFYFDGAALRVANSAGLNYEAAKSHLMKVRVTDRGGAGASYEENFTIAVSDVNEAPVATAGVYTISENVGPMTTATTNTRAQIGDPDAPDDIPVFTLEGTGSEKFEILANGDLRFKGVSAGYGKIDYEVAQAYNLTLKVQDWSNTGSSSGFVTAPITINIVNENDAPTLNSNFWDETIHLYGNVERSVLHLSATDPENNSIYFSVESSNGSGWSYATSSPWIPEIEQTASGQADLIFHTSDYPDEDYFVGDIVVRLSDDGYPLKYEDYTFHVETYGVSLQSPIVLDLDGDGVSLTAFADTATYFDQDGDGVKDKTGWVGAGDGILALDRNNNGVIDDGSEIRFSDDQEHAVSDLEGLRVFDTNHNGFFDAGDAQFASFRIWRDANQNAVSEASELYALADLDVTSINLTLSLSGASQPTDENSIYGTTEFARTNGTHGVAGDVMLAYQSTVPKVTLLGNLAPVVIDLDGDGVELVERNISSVKFDVEGKGLVRTGWVAADDAVLALDRNRDGAITTGSEISFTADVAGAVSDLEGLRAYDSNANGFFDAGDARFAEFLVWQDLNQDGVSQADELRGLSQLNIQAINLTQRLTGQSAEVSGQNVVYATTALVKTDGSQLAVGDIMLAYDAWTSGEGAPSGPPPHAVDRSSNSPASPLPAGPTVDKPDPVASMSDAPHDYATDASRARRNALADHEQDSEQPDSIAGDEEPAETVVEDPSVPAQPVPAPRSLAELLGASWTDVACLDAVDYAVDSARAPSALDTALALAQKQRFGMIQAIAGFSREGAAELGPSAIRQGHADSLALLTSLPDLRA